MEAGTRNVLTRDEMERRRLCAAQDLIEGCSQSRVARKFGVSRTTASRWQRSLSHHGLESLRKRKAPGRPTRLTAAQMEELVEMFFAGPRSSGLNYDKWTTVRLAQAIRQRFDIQYDPDHVGRLMHRLGLRKRDRVGILGPPDHAVSRYSPNTDLSRSEISPTVA